jgi:hypothetical protein
LLPGDGMATVLLPPSQELLAHDGRPGIKHWLTRYGPRLGGRVTRTTAMPVPQWRQGHSPYKWGCGNS